MYVLFDNYRDDVTNVYTTSQSTNHNCPKNFSTKVNQEWTERRKKYNTTKKTKYRHTQTTTKKTKKMNNTDPTKTKTKTKQKQLWCSRCLSKSCFFLI